MSIMSKITNWDNDTSTFKPHNGWLKPIKTCQGNVDCVQHLHMSTNFTPNLCKKLCAKYGWFGLNNSIQLFHFFACAITTDFLQVI